MAIPPTSTQHPDTPSGGLQHDHSVSHLVDEPVPDIHRHFVFGKLLSNGFDETNSPPVGYLRGSEDSFFLCHTTVVRIGTITY